MSTSTDSHGERAAYLQDLKITVNARSPWLLRDFLDRWRATLGPVASVVEAKTDDDLRALLDELAAALRGDSTHQLAAQLVSPWFVKRAIA